ncbi:GNAT family N-acetyltransferase [Pseudoalteromonas luteoviolacea]|uniref:Putative acetyltransferase n=1 Tax=Pseudoalteromonas luteoviolacea (strain 2ta16) TaxID=1353533 RepID=V4HWZ4_PSEL2|nr:GNAT family N-acetyltransferase [Pseudoalteromonas luteoviolacea]ESP92479.1 putative acetyltransferase [Pseudoalteromonas luteoviolacea 2ta16]KZN35038.1 hypothetical protein N483_24155 [Pseudoalteromonas luteoviolacea NCIMB 1944]
MTTSNIVLKQQAPTVEEFAAIRVLIGWSNPQLSTLANSMQASLFWVSAYRDDKLIGTGRVIGDGSMYFYIQDIIVHPEHQNIGLGSQIMGLIGAYLDENCQSGATIGLLAAQGKETFYEKFGFTSRDGTKLGLGMCKFV